MNINGNEITITEDSLTNALFNGATLEAFGSFTKAEARQAARVMLAAPELLDALKEALAAARLAAIHDHHDTANPLPWYQGGLNAIAKAEGRE